MRYVCFCEFRLGPKTDLHTMMCNMRAHIYSYKGAAEHTHQCDSSLQDKLSRQHIWGGSNV